MNSSEIRGKVFISQPMQGLSNDEIKLRREKAVKYLTGKGYEVIDSVFDFEDVDNVKNKSLYYLSKSLELVAREADVVYFMHGWKDARGCSIEYLCATAYNVVIEYEDVKSY